MKRVRYSKYTGSLADEMDLDSLLDALSDFLLDSGFRSPFSRFQEMNGDQTLDNLREALRQALESGGLFEDPMQERLDRKPDAMRIRRATVEHPFGTIKAGMGATHFRTRTLEKVKTEMSLQVLAYNMKRMINVLGVNPLMQAIAA